MAIQSERSSVIIEASVGTRVLITTHSEGSTVAIETPPSTSAPKLLNGGAANSHTSQNLTNGWAHKDEQPNSPAYKIKEQWHSQPGHLRVIHVGAGAAGLLMAYKMKKGFENYDLVCYEKNPEVGGTWFENRYPGVACDVPAHAYTFSSEPNPDWSSFYAYGPEIKRYMQGFAQKYDLSPFISLNSKVLKAEWKEEKGIYEVQVDVNGTIIEDWCHILVNGTGFLNSWKWPTIPGLQSFEGKLLHSASWDSSVDYAGKRVAVIGTGSSAIQIVPQIQKAASHLTSFMRSVTWISPMVGQDALDEQKETGEGTAPPNAQYYFSELEKKRFRDDPEFHLQYRKKLESAVNNLFEMFLKDTETNKEAEKLMRAEMHRRIGPGHEELKQKLIPSWPPGCRRITPGDGYLEALVQPNVTTCHKEITEIVPGGVIDESGKLHEIDVLVCATGFNLAFAPSFEVIGSKGVTMADEFREEPQVYLATTVPKFPNYFVINGVRGNWAAGTALPSHEVCVEYVLKCAKRLQAEGIRAIEVKQEPVDQLYEHIDLWHARSVWGADCKSWYKNNIIGGKLWIWGGSALHFMKTIKDVAYEDYDIRYRSKNKWEYLGNGRVEAEVKHDLPNLTPYMRNSDTPWEIK